MSATIAKGQGWRATQPSFRISSTDDDTRERRVHIHQADGYPPVSPVPPNLFNS